MSKVYAQGRLFIDDTWYPEKQFKELHVDMLDSDGQSISGYITKEDSISIIAHLADMFELAPKDLTKLAVVSEAISTLEPLMVGATVRQPVVYRESNPTSGER